MKSLIVFVVLAASALIPAQVTPFEIGVGYGQSARFDKESGGRGRMEGPVLSVSQSILKLPVVGEARIGVSALFGGGLSSGSDTDGEVYRVFAHYRSPALGPSGIYLLAGGNWATAKGRGGSFGEMSRFGTDFGVGMGIGPSLPVVPKASVELISHQSRRAQLRGWTLGLKFRL